jgi:wyosine [tRNA(Phe)-imidazoG37] synthetase (radical SAM superfamily)
MSALPSDSSPNAFQWPREFSKNRFVYSVISPRACGLSIGVNMNPDQQCNFDCIYCEVDRREPVGQKSLDIDVMVAELREELMNVLTGKIRENPHYAKLPEALLKLRHVTLSGDGEPTLCSNFAEAVGAILHVRALGQFPFFKLVLVTNATGLDTEQVERAVKVLHPSDEVWVKLDAGSPEYFQKINRPQVPLPKVMGNIIKLGRKRPVVIQSLFPLINGEEPAEAEIEQYVARLQELKAAGTQISLVQVYSATRPIGNDSCGHLPLKCLSKIAKAVRTATGLKAEVF